MEQGGRCKDYGPKNGGIGVGWEVGIGCTSNGNTIIGMAFFRVGGTRDSNVKELLKKRKKKV